MASARPILTVTPPGSELAHIVKAAHCGWIVPPGSPVDLAELITQLMDKESVCVQRGQNGRAYLEKHYSRNHCVDAYEKMLITLCNHNPWKSADAGRVG
jgi:glycosyltransferase involved in cell wall biosynthesis